MKYFLGIDTGATKTHALIADQNGEVMGFGESGSGNHEVVGYDGLANALQDCTGKALSMANLQIDQIAGAGFGVAGYDFPSEREPTFEAIASLGLVCPVEAVNDVTLGVIAGTSEGWGLAVDAGTGNNVRGRDKNGREGMVTGCGSTYGEFGGAGEIVRQAIIRVTYEWTQRGQPTQLTPAFIQWVGARGLMDLIEGLVLDDYHIHADAAPLVFDVAARGDTAAREVITWVSRELGETAVGVIHQLNFENEEFEVVLIGSVFNGGDITVAPLVEIIRRAAPKAQFSRLRVPPVVGAALLGMEQEGYHSNHIRQHLIKSAETFVNNFVNKNKEKDNV